MPRLVGLTGGLASGKSTVAAGLAAAGFLVVDADRLVAELYRPGAAGARAVAEIAGDDVLDADGGVDHRALATRLFADPALRRAVERAVHPLVRDRFAALAAASDAPVAVLEATLLVEAGYRPDFDLVVTVESPPQAQLARAIERGMSEDEARRRLAAQGDGSPRRATADLVLVNDGTLADLDRQVADLAARLTEPNAE